MAHRIIIALIGLMAVAASSAASPDLGRLNDILSRRESFVEAKERRIDSIRHRLESCVTDGERMKCCDALYREYLTFRFDSAMAYIERSERLAGDGAEYAVKARLGIHRAQSLATSGHFSEAIGLLDAIDSTRLPDDVRCELYAAMQWTYAAWEEYSGQTSFAAKYGSLSIMYLDSLLATVNDAAPEHAHYSADRALRRGEYGSARTNYRRVVDAVPRDTRLYAQAAYGLAMAYRGLGDPDSCREWLINAAIADQIIPLKENLALQELALDIRTGDGDLATANQYLKYSLEDAIFYNNRLRMLEISNKIPDIVLGYQDTITAQNHRLKMYVMCIGFLLAGLAIAACVIVREKKKVVASRQELSELNARLSLLNGKLAQTNVSREQYVSLFMDLCAAYIEKLNRFQSTVVLKIKVRQFDDLLRVANHNARPTDAEMREIFFNFDTAFLRLYPDFIEKFNTLLRPDQAIVPKPNELLNTDLRIFALVRMGIKDSTKIATLLFYSPQTIFNHRTQIRNRAVNRDTFEQEVMEICSVMPE